MAWRHLIDENLRFRINCILYSAVFNFYSFGSALNIQFALLNSFQVSKGAASAESIPICRFMESKSPITLMSVMQPLVGEK